jgi:hypothetical protein
MKLLLWAGLAVLILGIASIFIPIPRTERDGVSVGGLSLGVETHHDEKVSPIISGVLVLGGAILMLAARKA